MAIKTVQIEEKSAYIDVQEPDGSVTRYFPINRILDVIGAKELNTKHLNVIRLLMANPYIAGTDADGNKKLFRLEVENGVLYLSDDDTVPADDVATTPQFQELVAIIQNLFSDDGE